VISPMWSIVTFFMLLFSAVLSARLFAEEKKQKTFELLMTAPVRSIEIVLGKYLGGLGVITVMLLMMLVYPGLLVAFGSTSSGTTLDWGTVWLGYLVVFLVGAAGLAVGMFISSLTDSVIIAALVSLILMLLWLLAPALAPQEEPLRGIVNSFMLATHQQSLSQGILDLKPLVFFGSVVSLFLLLTHRAVEAHRWG
jgi:ABC-2 type transport system permease protein